MNLFRFQDFINTILGCRGRDRMVVRYTTTYAIVPITSKFVRFTPAYSKMYSIQHYIFKLLKSRIHEHANRYTTDAIIDIFFGINNTNIHISIYSIYSIEFEIWDTTDKYLDV
jgi:hypothetical protein